MSATLRAAGVCRPSTMGKLRVSRCVPLRPPGTPPETASQHRTEVVAACAPAGGPGDAR